jgi:hypothetical protein
VSARSEAAGASSGADTLSLILLILGLVGAVLELFFHPFTVALPALIITMVGIRVSDRYRRLGVITMFAITLGFLIGASFAVWDSRPLL